MKEDHGNLDGLKKLTKIVLFTLAVVVSVQIIINTTYMFDSLIFLAIVWTVGILFYRKRHFFSAWNKTQKPLKIYLAEQRKKEIYENSEEFIQKIINQSRDNALDSAYETPLSENEEKVWASIITQISDTDNR